MRPTDREPRALDRLSRLAEALRRIGLTADLVPDRRPFPGLAVRLPPGTATHTDSPRPGDVIRIPAGTVMILAGSAHYWRQRANGDLQLVGPLEEPAETAGRILDHLWSGRNAVPHLQKRFQRASRRGVSWN